MPNTTRFVGSAMVGLVLRVTGWRFTKVGRHAEAGRTDCGRCPALKAWIYRRVCSTVAANEIANGDTVRSWWGCL